MKIYTRTGDDGSTGLIGGSRVDKGDARIECYGTVDELNAALGVAVVLAGASHEQVTGLLRVQNELFVIGSHLAVEQEVYRSALPALSEDMIARLEQEIDAAEKRIPPLRAFILPGGSPLAAQLHVARTICRRGERVMVGFAHTHPVPPLVLIYMNRLGDWLFVQARLANHLAGIADVPWTHT